MEPLHDYLFKIILIGDSGVGKTCLMRRYTDNIYSQDAASTIGVDFKIKTIEIDKKIVKLQIWDTAGQERFRAIVAHYYRGANGILLVFDITNHESFQHLRDWMAELQRRDVPRSTHIKIIANKLDSKDSASVSTEEIEAFMKEYRIPPENFCEVSARDDVNVESAFVDLTKKLMKTCKHPSSGLSSKMAFKVDQKSRRSGCC